MLIKTEIIEKDEKKNIGWFLDKYTIISKYHDSPIGNSDSFLFLIISPFPKVKMNFLSIN